MLPKLEAFREYELLRVNEVAAQYTEGLKSVVKTPVIPEGYVSSWAQYTIQLENEEERDRLQAYLRRKGIPTMVYYPIPMHRQKAFAGETLYQKCPVAERLCRRVLSLPMHPYLEKREIEAVIKEIRDFF